MSRERCSACRHPVHRQDDYVFCSEFCATVPEKDRRAWQTAKIGDWCVYPCSTCGFPIEDEISRDRTCSSCWPVVSLKRLLRRCVRHVPEKLQAQIRKAVKR